MAKVYSSEVLEDTPPKATKLLSAIGRYTAIRTTLGENGMGDDDLERGRTLLLACLAAPRAVSADTDTESARKQREATAELDAFDEPNFPRYEAALENNHAAVGAVIFRDLKPATGALAVAGVATFSLRVEGLVHAARSPKEAKQAKVSDAVVSAAGAYSEIPVDERKRALALLEKRGLTAQERARLEALVRVALGPTATAPAVSAAETEGVEKRRLALTALRRWYDDWAATARATIRKKSYLIALVLASRKPPRAKTS